MDRYGVPAVPLTVGTVLAKEFNYLGTTFLARDPYRLIIARCSTVPVRNQYHKRPIVSRLSSGTQLQ
jgi:hypothetical protein